MIQPQKDLWGSPGRVRLRSRASSLWSLSLSLRKIGPGDVGPCAGPHKALLLNSCPMTVHPKSQRLCPPPPELGA